MDRPLVRGLLDRPDDVVALLGGAPGRREVHHVAHDLRRVGGVVDERRARIAISSPNTVATSWAWPVHPT